MCFYLRHKKNIYIVLFMYCCVNHKRKLLIIIDYNPHYPHTIVSSKTYLIFIPDLEYTFIPLISCIFLFWHDFYCAKKPRKSVYFSRILSFFMVSDYQPFTYLCPFYMYFNVYTIFGIELHLYLYSPVFQ